MSSGWDRGSDGRIGSVFSGRPRQSSAAAWRPHVADVLPSQATLGYRAPQHAPHSPAPSCALIRFSVFSFVARSKHSAALPAPLAAQSSPTSCNHHRTSATVVPSRASTLPLSRLSLGKGTLAVSTNARHGEVSPELELYVANYHRGILVLLFLRG